MIDRFRQYWSLELIQDLHRLQEGHEDYLRARDDDELDAYTKRSDPATALEHEIAKETGLLPVTISALARRLQLGGYFGPSDGPAGHREDLLQALARYRDLEVAGRIWPIVQAWAQEYPLSAFSLAITEEAGFVAADVDSTRSDQEQAETPTTPIQLPKELPDDAWMTSNEIAKKCGVKQEALRKRLDRWRVKNLDGGWTEATDRRPNQPKYLYQIKDVRPIFDSLKTASGESSGKRPAE